jgi:imidazolonepropionase-like amidohydrolase
MGVSKRYLATAAPIEKREKYIAIRNKIVKAIYDAGGRVMAGSDTPEWLLLYGHTLHLEMIDLRDAGLSNYASLEAATRNPALFFGTADKTGTIEKGKRADLVLLEADQIAPRFQHALDEHNQK